jgi:hypothetical protein
VIKMRWDIFFLLGLPIPVLISLINVGLAQAVGDQTIDLTPSPRKESPSSPVSHSTLQMQPIFVVPMVKNHQYASTYMPSMFLPLKWYI